MRARSTRKLLFRSTRLRHGRRVNRRDAPRRDIHHRRAHGVTITVAHAASPCVAAHTAVPVLTAAARARPSRLSTFTFALSEELHLNRGSVTAAGAAAWNVIVSPTCIVALDGCTLRVHTPMDAPQGLDCNPTPTPGAPHPIARSVKVKLELGSHIMLRVRKALTNATTASTPRIYSHHTPGTGASPLSDGLPSTCRRTGRILSTEVAVISEPESRSQGRVKYGGVFSQIGREIVRPANTTSPLMYQRLR